MADVPTLDEFRDECTAFLDANAEKAHQQHENKKFVWGEGEDDISLFDETDREAEKLQLAEAKQWRAKRYDAGLGWISGPVELGGRGLPATYDRMYASLDGKYMVPPQVFFGIGLGMVSRTILDHALEHVKAKFLPAL